MHWREPHLKFPHEANAPRLPFPRQYYTFYFPHPNFLTAWRSGCFRFTSNSFFFFFFFFFFFLSFSSKSISKLLQNLRNDFASNFKHRTISSFLFFFFVFAGQGASFSKVSH